MSDKPTEENPPLTARQKRRARQKELAAAALAKQIPVVPKLQQLGGRRRVLDPDQATMDATMKTIEGMGSIQSTIRETAAVLNVSIETLYEFFSRYPAARERYDDALAIGVSSIKRQLFKNLAGDPVAKTDPDPSTAMWLGARVAGIRDPDKAKEIELRERQVAATEKLVELRAPADLGSGLPIDIKSLSLAQLMQLLDRIRAAMAMGNGLTIDAVASREPAKTG